MPQRHFRPPGLPCLPPRARAGPEPGLGGFGSLLVAIGPRQLWPRLDAKARPFRSMASKTLHASQPFRFLERVRCSLALRRNCGAPATPFVRKRQTAQCARPARRAGRTACRLPAPRPFFRPIPRTGPIPAARSRLFASRPRVSVALRLARQPALRWGCSSPASERMPAMNRPVPKRPHAGHLNAKAQPQRAERRSAPPQRRGGKQSDRTGASPLSRKPERRQSR